MFLPESRTGVKELGKRSRVHVPMAARSPLLSLRGTPASADPWRGLQSSPPSRAAAVGHDGLLEQDIKAQL